MHTPPSPPVLARCTWPRRPLGKRRTHDGCSSPCLACRPLQFWLVPRPPCPNTPRPSERGGGRGAGCVTLGASDGGKEREKGGEIREAQPTGCPGEGWPAGGDFAIRTKYTFLFPTPFRCNFSGPGHGQEGKKMHKMNTRRGRERERLMRDSWKRR